MLPFPLRATPRDLVILLAVLLPACSCPPLEPSYGSPRETLGTWQAALCHDEPQVEYGCLSRVYRRSIGGWETYQAARTVFLESRPLTAWLLVRADLDDHIEQAWRSDDGRTATVRLRKGEHSVTVRFERETLVSIEFSDGRIERARLEGALTNMLGTDDRGWWIGRQTRPPLVEQDLAGVRSVHFQDLWRIAYLEGLQGAPLP